ncbi:NAD-dependent epimerase/dehydratase family protein [Ammonicoccus fulvus]|uniref:NAD-dependent epimerase/dehydratase family protein n=1 Tax=Ammonicoccus fulvus TaxID=3138240 RepID=A0ABZ3FS23_9ACTN
METNECILVVGGTGLLGAATAAELVSRGYAVRALARRRRDVPDGVDLRLGDVATLSDVELRALVQGCTGVVFAAGLDERTPVRKPAYDAFVAVNNAPLGRLLEAARAEGVRRVVVLGSYFTHLARTRPDLDLGRWHPYVRSRIDQAELALAYADGGLDVSIIEVPYVFGVGADGALPGVSIMVDAVRRMPGVVLWVSGGVAAVTVGQIAQAVVGALERSEGAASYPVVGANFTWSQLLRVFLRHLDRPRWPIVTVPASVFTVFLVARDLVLRLQGFEPGLDGVRLAALLAADARVDRGPSDFLGVEPANMDVAIGELVRATSARDTT